MVLAQQPEIITHDETALRRRWLTPDPADPQDGTCRDTITQLVETSLQQAEDFVRTL